MVAEVKEQKIPGLSVLVRELAHLKDLKGLQTLDLRYTKITDAGLKNLKELNGLQTGEFTS